MYIMCIHIKTSRRIRAILGHAVVAATLCRFGHPLMLVPTFTHLIFKQPLIIWGIVPEIRVSEVRQPSVIVVNHTVPEGRFPKQDGFVLLDAARHVYRASGIRSRVIVDKNARHHHSSLWPHYLKPIKGKNGRVRAAVEAIREGYNVIIFVVNSHVQRFGGTGVYHIMNESGAPSHMWLMRYERRKAIVETIREVPSVDTYGSPEEFVHSLQRQYSSFTEYDYDVGFERAM